MWGLKYVQRFTKDVDLWVHFATKLANVEDFGLKFITDNQRYEFPKFAYKNASLKSFFLAHYQLNPFGMLIGVVSFLFQCITWNS